MRLPSSYRYFDHAAGWPVREEALTAFVAAARASGNPGSVHRAGQRALAALDQARAELAVAFGCEPREVVLLSSATEANNLAMAGTVHAWQAAHPGRVPRIIVSAIEHDSVRMPAERLAGQGHAELVTVAVDARRGLDVKELESHITQDTALISVMQVSNETGSMMPVARIGRMIRAHRDEGIWPRFHVDAAQALAYVDELAGAHADLVTYSGYKAGAVAGSAALIVRSGGQLEPVAIGGGQERGLRSGTEDVAAAVSFARAAALARREVASESARMSALRALFVKELALRMPQAQENAPDLESAPHIVSVRIPGTHAQQTLAKLDLAGFAIGAGAACSARSLEPSKTLIALGYGRQHAEESVRVSFGPGVGESDVVALARAFA